MFERTGYISYANCGLPYYIGGTITDEEDLTLQTPESFWERFRVHMRVRLDELDRNKPVYVNCQSGLRSYVACRMLSQLGYECYNISGGYRLYEAVKKDRVPAEESFACGMEKQ